MLRYRKAKKMPRTGTLSITLPADMVRMIKDKVAGGEYATESEVICDGLRALQAREAEEQWLREDVVASCHEMEADPSRAVPIEDVLGRIKARV
jgi:putative addiction module CopG family antidote